MFKYMNDTPAGLEYRKKLMKWVIENRSENLKKEGENVMDGLGDDCLDGMDDGIVKEMMTNNRNKISIPPPYVEMITDIENQKKERFDLNKVKNFFGLESLDNVKADKLLETAADLFKTKNAEHGDAYLKIGYMLEQAFPDGVTLKTHHDFNKFTTLVQMFYKITRLCNTCFGEKETIHDSVFDSPRDLSVYGSIFGEIQIKELKDKVKKDAGKL